MTNSTCSSERPVNFIYLSDSSSTGKKPQVAPYSGAMLAIVARSANGKSVTPGPKNSTNLPTTPFLRSSWVTRNAKSVAVDPWGNELVKRTPITSGIGKYDGWPSIPASASIPPTPQPNTPIPFIIVVCESVPTSVSGKAVCSPSTSLTWTTLAKYSKLTWCTIPVAGGTAL